jgi:hypothetical protein
VKIVTERILNVGARWRLMISFTPSPLYLRGICPRCAFDRRLGGSQSQRERFRKLPVPGIKPGFLGWQPIFISCANGGSFCLKYCRLDTMRLCLLYVVPVVKRLVCACQNVTYLTYGASMTRWITAVGILSQMDQWVDGTIVLVIC